MSTHCKSVRLSRGIKPSTYLLAVSFSGICCICYNIVYVAIKCSTLENCHPNSLCLQCELLWLKAGAYQRKNSDRRHLTTS